MARQRRGTRASRALALLASVLLTATASSATTRAPYDGAAARARCGPGSLPERGLQGQVPKADRDSGRSRLGYRCNLVLVGQYQGEGASWVSPSTGTCAYLPQAFPASLAGDAPGVRVVDVRDPRHPRLATTLTSPAMLSDPWESLKINDKRGLLAGTSGSLIEGAAFFDVYSVRPSCSAPRLLSSVPITSMGLPAYLVGHEGGFSPDGRTYWASSGAPGVLTAIDVADPTAPRVLATRYVAPITHGLSLSPDGRTLYLSTINPNGLTVLDVSDVQDRKALPQLRTLGSLGWSDGANAQHSVPVSKGGRAYLFAVDEMGAGAVRVLDVADPAHPRLVSHVKLEIHLPQHAAERSADVAGTGLFGYEAHYCDVDRRVDPRLLACGFFDSGVRVFDVRDLTRPREVAYYNPPAQVGREQELRGSEHAWGPASRGGATVSLTADWCSSPPRFVGSDQLWVTCQDNGFMVLRLGLPRR